MSLKSFIAKKFGLLTVDQVAAIRPQISDDADKALVAGANDLAVAANKREKAAALDAQAAGLETNGTRRINAVEALRKAAGG